MPIVKRTFAAMPTATFPQRLRATMSTKGLNQSDVARGVGYTPTGVWNWLQGNTLPRTETLAALAEMLDVSEDWLRDGDTLQTDGAEPIEPPMSIADKIENLKLEISILTGCDVSSVRVMVDFGA